MRVDGPLIFNTAPPQVDAALAGLGLSLLPEDELMQHIHAGLLVREARGTRNCYKLRADRLRAFGSATSGLFDSLISDISTPLPLAEPA